MTEIFSNISDRLKDTADMIWNITIAQKTPAKAAEFLNNITEYYKRKLTEEEIEFLLFYFKMKMEMIKNG